jgi:chlorobactene glucosyltransferase
MTIPALIAAASVGMFFFLVKSRFNYLALPEISSEAEPPAASLDDVTVVIPARNEAGGISEAVRSFAGARVIVVDDNSSDSTAEEACAAGADVVGAAPLPKGWLGKPHACWTGSQGVVTDWILFADADTRYEPAFLATALGYAQRERLDLLTVFLFQQRRSLFERMLLPYAFALYFCGVSARAVNSSRAREALANGQCLLIRRSAYEAIGGHCAVASSVIEDVALARLAKDSGLALRVVRAESLGSVRMYDSLAAIWRGFQKNSFRFLRFNPRSAVQVILASIALTSYLPALAWLGWNHLWGPAALLTVLPSALLAPWYGGIRAALAAPAAIYLFQAIALDGMITALLGRKSHWKGREVS